MEVDDSLKQDPFIGTVIDGKYRIVEKIGHGGIGAVYRGEHTLIRRQVAIKVLHSHLVENEDFLRRFRHEAEIASSLTHPNAVILYDYGVEQSRPYLAMEYVQGETMKSWMSRESTPQLSEVCTIFQQIGAALEEAHRLGIIHRDLKPDNVIITRRDDGSPSVKVLDFGIAKVIHDKGEKGATVVTKAGTFYGTPRYASPEQIMGQELDRRADIYSLGVMLYEVLSGKPPFDAPSMIEVFLKHLNQEPPPFEALDTARKVPRMLESHVMRCLAKDPAKRPASAVEMMQELTRCTGESCDTFGFLRKHRLAATAAVGAICAAAAWFFIYNGPQPPEPAPDAGATAQATPAESPEPGPAASAISPYADTHATPQLAEDAPSEPPGDGSADVQFLFSEAKEHYRRRQYEQAAAGYEKVVLLKPDYIEAHLDLGVCYQRLNRMAEALEQFKKALELNRNHAPALYNLACYYAVLGDTDKALKFLELTIVRDPRAKQAAQREPDLASLRALPEFARITGKS